VKESTITEETGAGEITYKYIVHRPSRPWIQLLNVSMRLANGEKRDLTGGFFQSNDLILPDPLKRKMLFSVKGEG